MHNANDTASLRHDMVYILLILDQLRATVMPVSYTHLDVYKRQVQYTAYRRSHSCPMLPTEDIAGRIMLHTVITCLLYTSRCV